MAESAQFLEFPANSPIFYGSLDDTRPVASPANFNELETIFMRHMGEVMSNTVTAEAGMQAADIELAAAMAKLQGG